MLLIIACGNSLRSDDGAGLIFAERLEQACRSLDVAVERLSVHQLLPELAADIAAEAVRAVVFVDTRLAEPDDLPALHSLSPQAASPSVGHHLTPAVLLLYAQALYHHCPPAWQITVPGVNFDHGETLSETAQNALTHVPPLARQIAMLCR
ncbi:MAG: hydrogenase maturation protease [Anaerolineae bacterium]|nr:hydrogenase maturation protease [Anaerolineae bacterium]